MKKILDKKFKYIFITLLLFMLLNIALTFAYIRAETVGSESVSTVSLKAGGIYVEFANNSGNIVVSDIVPGFTTTKQFSVTSIYESKKDYYNVPLWYTIKIIVDKNEFDDNSIKYSINLDGSSSKDGMPFDSNLEEGILKGQNLEGVTVASGAFYNDNQTHVYNLTISYPETRHNQTHEINCEFAAHVEITNPDLINATFDLKDGASDGLMLDSSNSMKVPANSRIYFSNLFLFVITGDAEYSLDERVLKTYSSDVSLIDNFQTDFDYVGGEQEFIAKHSGYYKIELWGAQGGYDSSYSTHAQGGYTSGIIFLSQSEKLFVNVGETGGTLQKTSFNGGGCGGTTSGYSGGGATDVRLLSADVSSRLMVSAGGGGTGGGIYNTAGSGSYAGGLIGYDGGYYSGHSYNNQNGKGGTQISGGSAGNNIYNATGTVNAGAFGIGGDSFSTSSKKGSGGGGGGYFGGGAGGGTQGGGSGNGAGGGSSYISGHTGCVAIESSTSTTPRTGTDGSSCDTGTSDNLCSVHYSGKFFTDTVMIDGAGYAWTNTKGALEQMPNPSGGYYDSGVGHSGNGYARITYLYS